MSDEMPLDIMEKWAWTDANFGVMRWHDCPIHALGYEQRDDPLDPTRDITDLLFDIDYIFRWVPAPDDHIHFWISPATLVFHDTLWIQAEIPELPICQALEESDTLQKGAARELPDGRMTYHWSFGRFAFEAAGYTQYIRQVPRLVTHRFLTDAQRGGLSFQRMMSDRP